MKYRKVAQLEDVDVLLSEQHARKLTGISAPNGSSAKLKINESLFQVDPSNVVIKSILGEGGSDSTGIFRLTINIFWCN